MKLHQNQMAYPTFQLPIIQKIEKTAKTTLQIDLLKQFSQNNKVETYIFLLLIPFIEIFLLIYDQNTIQWDIILRISLFLIVLSLAIIFQAKFTEQYLIHISFILLAIQQIMIAIIHSEYFLRLIPFSFATICNNRKQMIIIVELLIQKLISLTLSILIFENLFLIIILCCLIIIDIIKLIQGIRELRINLIKHKESIIEEPSIQRQSEYCQQNDLSESQRIIDKQENEIWKQRFLQIPLSIIMISKKNFQITYKNFKLYTQYKYSYNNDSELDNLLLNKLLFTLYEDHKDIINQNSRNFIQLRKKTSSSIFSKGQNPYFHSSSFDSIVKRSLIDIITLMSSKQLKPGKDVIEIFCIQYEEKQVLYQLEGKILTNDLDDDYVVILNDISSQIELQQYTVKEEFKNKIIESFSHELRTPLNSALNFLNASFSDPSTTDDIKLNILEPTINSLKLQSYLINDIIDFQQYISHEFFIEAEPFLISNLMSNITSLFGFQLQIKGISLNLEFQIQNQQLIWSQETKLTQILINILQNSIKFTEQGLITLKVKAVPNDMIKFIIIDTGQGMNQEELFQIRKNFINIQEGREFGNIQQWKGFGLLIIGILHYMLSPPSKRLFKIKSQGINQGTKISFYIFNYQQSSKITYSTPSSAIGLRQSQSLLKSKHTNSSSLSQLLSANGGLYLKNDGFLVNSKFNKSGQQQSYSQESKSKRTGGTSDLSRSPKQLFNQPEFNINTLSFYQPRLITDIKQAYNSPSNNVENLNQQFNIQKQLNIQELRNLESIHIKDLIRTITSKINKCCCNNVLSVDDEVFNQKSIEILLKKLGFQVYLAFNGNQAINLLKQFEPCSQGCQLMRFILMDYSMPIKDGVQTTKELIDLMNEGQIPDIPIIGLTAFTSAQDVKNCFEAGMREVLSKPLKISDLNDILLIL